jgi:hyperosmotically inducible protein
MKVFLHRCALALLLLGSALAAAEETPASRELDDARREAQIWTAYATHESLHALGISVDVEGNRATLSGTVESAVEKELAEQIARGVEGIADVDNRLAVDPDRLAPAAAAGGVRDFATVVADATVTARVKSRLLWTDATAALDIDVDTRDGRVLLKGAADNATTRATATRIALDTRGVASVDNQIVVRPPDPRVANTARAEQTISDTWISAKVKSSLLFARHVDGSDIRVDTHEGVVKLSGRVYSLDERRHAIEIARAIRGVRKVDASGLRPG